MGRSATPTRWPTTWPAPGSTSNGSPRGRAAPASWPASRAATRDAPRVCLMGHTDVVPANETGWDEDPFAADLIGDELWGRGAVDMLNLTASMAAVARRLASLGRRPPGDLIFLGVADEEAAGTWGAGWLADRALGRHRLRLRAHRERRVGVGPRRRAPCADERGREGLRLEAVGRPWHPRPRVDAVRRRQCAADRGRGRQPARPRTGPGPRSPTSGAAVWPRSTWHPSCGRRCCGPTA